MPSVSRWFIKSGMIYFMFSLMLAVGTALNHVLSFSDVLTFAQPVFYHMLMVGWITQIIFGVSIWMFPRYSRENPRGNDTLSWLAWAFLNTGLLLRVIAEPLQPAHPGVFWQSALVISALLQLSAGVFYVLNIWGRVKER
ncbi:MAG: hypothetical protein R3C41_20600 [Calditrichia bacterium]